MGLVEATGLELLQQRVDDGSTDRTLTVLYLASLKLRMGQPIGGRPLLLLAVLLLILGVQLVGMGLLGEMVARVYHETQGKPIYMVKRTIHGVKAGGIGAETGQ